MSALVNHLITTTSTLAMALHFLYLCILVLAAPAIGSGGGEEAIEWLTPVTHDFGAINRYEPVRHDFQFRNRTDRPISIDNVRPSCGCMVPDWEAAAIEPDSIGTISVEYDARDSGYFIKKIKVYFSGLRKPELLYVEGDVF
jgi:hypothetical protein